MIHATPLLFILIAFSPLVQSSHFRGAIISWKPSTQQDEVNHFTYQYISQFFCSSESVFFPDIFLIPLKDGGWSDKLNFYLKNNQFFNLLTILPQVNNFISVVQKGLCDTVSWLTKLNKLNVIMNQNM